jgi:trehalose synthase
MPPLTHVPVAPLPPERFRQLLGERYAEIEDMIARSQELFSGRAVWHVNSTARGGGVAELLQSLLAYARGGGVDTRWVVIEGNPDFFQVTKRIHNRLHGSPGDGGPLGADERGIYEETLRANAEELADIVAPPDIVFLHDPQTAGLVDPILATGATVVWRCHVGLDLPNDLAREAWDFLREYVKQATAYVFSRKEFVWDGLANQKVWIIPPSIDAFSPKNQELSPQQVRGILSVVGVRADGDHIHATFVREDGTPGRVDRAAEMLQDEPIPDEASLITQVSRWDRLKDPMGIVRGFVEHLADPEAHLLLAGPSVAAVADDPEGAEVLTEVDEYRRGLDAAVRRRVHMAALPMEDIQENAAIVNAIQRRSEIVVQKSIAEGFGLTVSEAMWKARPVVATKAGGIQDQVVDGETGILLDDPHDLAAMAEALRRLLDDPEYARRLGEAGRQRVEEHFLGMRHLIQYEQMLAELLRHVGAAA